MQIGIPAEIIAAETRVAATPETVKKFIAAGQNRLGQQRRTGKANTQSKNWTFAG